MAKGQQRDLKREAFWRRALARFNTSGLSVRGFCARERLTEPCFYAWRRVIRQRDAEQEQSRPAFVPVVVGDAVVQGESDASGIVVELGNAPGTRSLTLRLPAAMPVRQVAELVHAIAAAPAPISGSIVTEARP
jgi:hypothetical protein